MKEFYKAVNYLRDNYPVELVPEELKRRSGYTNMVTTLARRLRWNTGGSVDVVYRKAQSGQEVAFYRAKQEQEHEQKSKLVVKYLPRYTLGDFKRKRLAIFFKSREESKICISKLYNSGFEWLCGAPNSMVEGSCIIYNFDALSWCDREFCEGHKFIIISPSQIIWEK